MPQYSSSAIADRRRRILRETRKMIAESGIQGFSVRELSKRSSVALRTLYNAFHSKDRLIAIAIREAYDDVQRRIRYRTSAETLEGIIDRLAFINSRNIRSRNYTRAVASLYFAPELSEDIWAALQHMVFSNMRQWLNRVEAEGELNSGVCANDLAMTMANIEYSMINDWAQGRIPDDAFIRRLVQAILHMSVGTMHGHSLAKAQEFLDGIARTGKLPDFPSPGWRELPAEQAQA